MLAAARHSVIEFYKEGGKNTKKKNATETTAIATTTIDHETVFCHDFGFLVIIRRNSILHSSTSVNTATFRCESWDQ